VRRAVFDLFSSRPVWQPTREVLLRMRAAFPGDWDVAVVRHPTSSDGDGARASAAARRRVRGAEVYVGWGVAPEIVTAAFGSLRWVHTAAAGVAGSISQELRRSGAVLTNSRGVHAEPMADWVLTAIGCCARGFHAAVAARHARRWAKDDFTDGTVPVRELRGLRVGIVGLGGVGRTIARRCAALGMVARGVRARPGRLPRGVEWVGGPEALPDLACWCDVLVVSAPATPATAQLIGASVLGRLRRGSFLVNVARGSLVDEQALIAVLDSGHLAGAVLDVFAVEPLPRQHPLWRHPCVLVTPHVSAVTDRFWEREAALVVDNVHRYLTGRRLRNRVNLQRGY
jgi:phosphoglycerate dehydrogenase-like enzyme